MENLFEAPRKLDVRATRRSTVEEELKKIFKLEVTFKPRPLAGTFSADFVIPADMDAETIDFTAGMIKRKLPSVVRKFLETRYPKLKEIEITGPRIRMPNMKSVTLQNGEKVKMMDGQKELTFFVSVIES